MVRQHRPGVSRGTSQRRETSPCRGTSPCYGTSISTEEALQRNKCIPRDKSLMRSRGDRAGRPSSGRVAGDRAVEPPTSHGTTAWGRALRFGKSSACFSGSSGRFCAVTSITNACLSWNDCDRRPCSGDVEGKGMWDAWVAAYAAHRHDQRCTRRPGSSGHGPELWWGARTMLRTRSVGSQSFHVKRAGTYPEEGAVLVPARVLGAGRPPRSHAGLSRRHRVGPLMGAP